MARKCFYSFHYELDSWRAAQVRNMGIIEGNPPAQDNDWETVKRGGSVAIQRWILSQMQGRSCTILLVGEQTAGRPWINYEIEKSWEKGMGVVGIHIHGLADRYNRTTQKGRNPFDEFQLNGIKLSSIIKCYDPIGFDSKGIYSWINFNIQAIVEEAINIRQIYR